MMGWMTGFETGWVDSYKIGWMVLKLVGWLWNNLNTLVDTKKVVTGQFIHQFRTGVVLILIFPSMNAVSKCSIIAMRRLKTYLQTTMTQEQLNHLLLFHIHQDQTDSIPCLKIVMSFVGGSEHRLSVIGKFRWLVFNGSCCHGCLQCSIVSQFGIP